MNNYKYIAYEGTIYTIEWYYNENGKSQAYEYYQKLTDTQKRKLLLLFKRIGDYGIIRDKTKFINEGDNIYAFKPQPDRFLSFFVKDKKIIITNAFIKKSQKLPKNEKLKAQKYRIEYLERIKSGDYYE